MLEIFINDERGYLRWTARNQHGFIVNADHDHVSSDYPMVHRATHKALTSPKRQNYTTKRFLRCVQRRQLSWNKGHDGKEEGHYGPLEQVI